jgi:murein DD-endopeptidase MepM/ murein hydrolase activator NlpD
MNNNINKIKWAGVWTGVALALALGLSACGSSTTAPIHAANSPAPAGYYRVKSGDTLYAIARKHKQSVANLRTWNALNANGDIAAGQLLKVQGSAMKKPSQSTSSTKVSTPSNSPMAVAVNPPKNLVLIWPVQGTVLASFNGTTQKGLDIGGALGSPIKAAANGEVIYAGNGVRGYGNMVIIKHEGDFTSTYAHLNRALVAEGQKVSLGQVIAEMGDTAANRPKLYFEVRYQGKVTNPINYLP